MSIQVLGFSETAGRGIGLTVALVFVIGRGVYRQVVHRRLRARDKRLEP
jgi:hypothetical protein